MTTKTQQMTSLNLPNFPAAIRNALKAEAAIAGVSLKHHVEAILAKHLAKKAPKPSAQERTLPLPVANQSTEAPLDAKAVLVEAGILTEDGTPTNSAPLGAEDDFGDILDGLPTP